MQDKIDATGILRLGRMSPDMLDETQYIKLLDGI